MTSIDRLVRPWYPEGRSSALQEGFIYGLIPGVIADINDPEGIGRVKVECPLIQAHSNLPNDTDGWIPVAEDFVVNSSQGGRHTLLQVGSQVIMGCLFGDPRQMIVLKCLPSRVDRPFNEFHRGKGTYGSVTPGQVIEANDDTDASQVIARPNGMVQSITGDGTLTYQTRDHARLQLQQDGTARIENDKAFAVYSQDGTVTQRSAEGATSILHKNGTVQMIASSTAKLLLQDDEARMDGPLSELSAIMQDIQANLSGSIGEAQSVLSTLNSAIGKFIPGESDLQSFIKNLDSGLSKVSDFLPAFEQGLSRLDKLQDFSVEKLGKAVAPQIDAVLGINLNSINFTEIEQVLRGGLRGENLVQAIEEAIGRKFPKPQELVDALEGLRFDRNLQIQVIASALSPKGFKSIENMIGLDLHRVMTDLNQIVGETRAALEQIEAEIEAPRSSSSLDLSPEPQQALITPEEAAQRRQAILDRGSERLQLQIPERLRGFIQRQDLKTLLKLDTDVETILPQLTGYLVKGMGEQVRDRVQETRPVISKVNRLHRLARALGQGRNELIDEALKEFDLAPNRAESLIQQAAEQVLSRQTQDWIGNLKPMLQQNMDSLNQLINAIPDGTPGSIVRATNTKVQMETYLGAAGAIARVGEEVAELIAPFGTARVFAKPEKAGISSPFGEFGFGSGGGDLFSLGEMVLRVARSQGGSAGVLLSPGRGASLSSFDEQDDDDDRRAWRNENARVVVRQNTVLIETLSNDSVQHRIRVTSKGIWFDNYNVDDLMNSLEDLILRMTESEARTNELTSRVETIEIGGEDRPALTWRIADENQTALPNSGYLVNAPSLITLTLPAEAPFGSGITVVAHGLAGWRIAQLEGHVIEIGDRSTTTGITGRVGSTAVGDSIELVYQGTGRWRAIGITGNLEIV